MQVAGKNVSLREIEASVMKRRGPEVGGAAS